MGTGRRGSGERRGRRRRRKVGKTEERGREGGGRKWGGEQETWHHRITEDPTLLGSKAPPQGLQLRLCPPALRGWLTGVVGHQLLQAVELGAGGDVEAAAVQLADLVVLHVEALGVVEVGH